MALLWYRRLRTAAGGKDATHAAGMQEQGPAGPAGVRLPRAGLSGGRAEQIATSSLPCSLCPSGRRGLGRGCDCLLLWGCLWTHTSCSLPGRDGARGGWGQDSRLRAGWRIYSCRTKSSISKPVASSFGHANKVLTRRQLEALMYSCLFQKPGEPLP